MALVRIRNTELKMEIAGYSETSVDDYETTS